MPETTTSTSEPPAIGQPRRRKKRRLAAVATMVVFALCVAWYQLANSRYKVIGKVDPRSGYRIEYTVSSRFRKGGQEGFGPVISCSFKPAPPPPAVQWLVKHVLRRQSPVYYPTIDSDVPFDSQGTKSWVKIDEQGNPYLRWSSGKEAHLLLADCHTTWVAYLETIKVLPHMDYYILIKPNDQHVIFAFRGYEDIDRTEVLSEMLKIRDSIRVVKVR